MKWAENFETQTVGDALVFELMEERFSAANGKDATFAKGQELRPYKGFETWSHGGTDAGYRSFLLRVPSEDLEISVISNRTDFDKATFAFELADVFLFPGEAAPEEPVEDWAPASADDLAAYAGDYELFPGVIFALRAEQGGLTLAMGGAPRTGLEPLPQIGPRAFQLNAVPERTLILDAPVEGRSPSLQYKLAMDGALEAPRIELVPFDPASTDVSEFTGRCHSEELATFYDLKLVDGGLVAVHPRQPEFALTPYQPDAFIGQGALQELTFERAENGRITGFYGSGALAERVWFACG